MIETNASGLNHHAIIAGFGVPGRAVAEWLTKHSIPYVVIEQNKSIVDRCSASGVTIVGGDTRDQQVLLRAGIDRADIFAVAVPDEAAVLQAVQAARALNPKLQIIARCTFISGGLEAVRRGADQTIVAEQIVAREFMRLLDEKPTGRQTGDAIHSQSNG